MTIRRAWIAALLSSLVLLPLQADARCGVQRWSVKTGTDPQAAGINLSLPSPTTIAFLTDLSRFPPPSPWPPTSRIAPVETTLWTLDATLDSFKFENDPTTGDSDYHLIIKDALGNTMVAEIPMPACVQGSVWENQIAVARQTFDDRFTATGSFKSAQNVPVRIAGIAMFDKMAHGSGHSPNGLEIHPILSLEFNPGTGPAPSTPALPDTTPAPLPSVTPGPSSPNLILNGDFEDGDAHWSESAGVITNQAQAHVGFWLAWFGGYGRTHTDTLEQNVELPSGSDAELSFWLRIETEEVEDRVFDRLKVQVTDTAGAVLSTLHTFSNRAAGPHYERVHFDMTPFLGQRIRIRLVASEDSAKATSFYLDSIRLLVNR